MPKFFGNVRSKWCDEHNKVFQQFAVAAFQLTQLANTNHKRRDARVVREGLNVVRHFLYQFVDALQLFWRCLLIVGQELVVAAVEECPEFLQEAVATVNAVGVPRFRLLNRSEEHLVETKSVGTVFLHNHVGVDNVEHRLRHFFYCPSADVLAVFKNKLSILVFRTPSLESLNVELVCLHDVHVNVDWSDVVVVLKSKAYECRVVLAFLIYTIDKVGTTLNHALVDKFLERLVGTRISTVVEELVPEARVDKVTCSMLSTTHIEVNTAPIFVGILAHKSLVVLWIHIAQIVSRRTSETRHGVKFKREYGLVVDKRLVHHFFLHGVPSPFLCSSEWRFACLSRLILVNLRQQQRQFLLWNHIRHLVLVINRERLAPISLT